MNKLLRLTLALMLLCCVSAFSQGRGQGRPGRENRGNGEKMADVLTKKLMLNTEQHDKLQALFAKQREGLDAVRQATKKDTAARKAQIKTLRSDTESGIKTILTPDQYTKYLAFKAERKQKMKARLQKQLDELED